MTAAAPHAVGLPPRDTIAATRNVIGYFDAWVARDPERTAIVFPRGRAGAVAYDSVTYGQLAADVARCAGGLRALGVEPGDRVLIMVPMSRPLYTFLMAVLKLGATAVFIDPWAPLDQIAYAAELVEPKVFAGVAKAHLLRVMRRAFRRIPIQLVACSTWPLLPRLLGRSVESLYRGGRAEPVEEVVPRDPDDTALITFTSGSSGVPKGSNRTHAFLDAQAIALEHHLEREPGDVDMPALPVFVLNNLVLGVPSVLPLVDFRRIADVEPAAIVQELRDWKVTTIGGSPAYLAPIAAHCRAEGVALETVRGVVTGGAPVPPPLLRELREVCPGARGNVTVLFGSTEAEPVACIEADEVLGETAARTEAGEGNCVGRPVPDVELKVVRPDPGPWQLEGRGWDAVEVAPGEVGELLVTGDHVQKDYYRNPDAVRANKVEGPDGRVWHRMGDLARRDDQGRLWLVGRVHDVVRSGDAVLYPIQVEGRANACPGVRASGLVALGDRAVLAIEAAGADPAPGLAEAVRAAVTGDGFPVDEVVPVAAIPVDPRHNAKVDHGRLRAQLEAARG